MRYGTSKSAHPWKFSIGLPSEPRCPGCAEYLQGVVIEFRDGWAWCPVCVAMGLHYAPWIAEVLESESMRECSSVVNGLRFYTPDVINGESETAYEQCERLCAAVACSVVLHQPEDAYALTPSGEHLLADLDVSELQQVERDTKRAHAKGN